MDSNQKTGDSDEENWMGNLEQNVVEKFENSKNDENTSSKRKSSEQLISQIQELKRRKTAVQEAMLDKCREKMENVKERLDNICNLVMEGIDTNDHEITAFVASLESGVEQKNALEQTLVQSYEMIAGIQQQFGISRSTTNLAEKPTAA